jgi:hypothetical protein
MSSEEQVFVIAFFAVALKLLLWSREEDVVGVPDRKDVLPLMTATATPSGTAARRN